jgi:hypothetical protein
MEGLMASDDLDDLGPEREKRPTKPLVIDVDWPSLTHTSFWADRPNWAVDSEDYVFLARAFEEVGKAMFGRAWTGDECSSTSDRKLKPLHLARLAAVQDAIATAGRSGELKFGHRPREGGDVKEAPASWWATEAQHYRRRFYACQINADDPFGHGDASNRYSWIYVTRQSLDKFLDDRPFAPKAIPVSSIPMSDYLHAAIEVSRKGGYVQVGEQPSIDEIVEMIREEWAAKNLPPLSPSRITELARCVRGPGSKGGRRPGTKI